MERNWTPAAPRALAALDRRLKAYNMSLSYDPDHNEYTISGDGEVLWTTRGAHAVNAVLTILDWIDNRETGR